MNYLSMCCIAKDEDLFIAEWLAYYSLIGVEHFYIYDNESATPLAEHPMVAKGLDQGRITVVEIPGKARQIPAYNHCLSRFGGQNRWIGFLDVDEFICFADTMPGQTAPPDLRLFLTDFEPYAALVLNWRIIGSSGHIRRPDGLVTANYTQALKEPSALALHVKSIVRPDAVREASTPHAFLPLPGKYAVDERFRPVSPNAPVAPISWEKLWINHYLYKSQQDLEAKQKRGRADITSSPTTVPYEQFYWQAAASTVTVPQAAYLAPLVAPLVAANTLAPLSPVPESPRQEVDLISCGLEKLADTAGPESPGEAPQNRRLSPQEWLDRAAKTMTGEGPDNTGKVDAVLREALEQHPDNALLWTMRGYAARHRREFDRALLFLRKSITLEELPQTYEELFHLALAMNDKAEARRILFYLRHTPLVRLAEPQYSQKLAMFDKALAAR